jgi:hypothetical protein
MFDNYFAPFLPAILVREVAIFHDNYPMLSVWMSLTASEVSANNSPRPYKARQDKLSKEEGEFGSRLMFLAPERANPSRVLRI